MTSFAPLLFGNLLALYIAWEVIRFHRDYPSIKAAIAGGDMTARPKMYREWILFEWICALLVLCALKFDWSKLTPGPWGLDEVFPRLSHALTLGMVGGFVGAVVSGGLLMIAMRIRTNRRGTPARHSAALSRIKKHLPDFSWLIPVTPRERWLFAALSISAGICEEIVFRGWLLSTLHGWFGLQGLALVAVASAAFGLAHSYQGAIGVVATGTIGWVFCFLYVATGSLLVPILIHILVDIRWVFVPAPRTAVIQAAHA
ncbi:MAG TPA: CPBP family intramembrane glutamic endopeptidase [Candidatus Angelobacter sp.]|nr:CPBP family intramembrane glutamic endopeptidase [Candidatus Angelobacter sp.]